MQEPEAEDQIELLVELVEVECVEAQVLDVRVEQLGDRPEALAALELDAPPRADPVAVLLVVDGDHASAPRASARKA